MFSNIKTYGEWIYSQDNVTPLIKTCGEWLCSHQHGVPLTLAGAAMAYSILRSPIKRTSSNTPAREFRCNDPDVIIIGSGVGGSALATSLARDGRKVTVIERDMKEPDRLVGELMQAAGIRALKKLGLGDVFCDIDAHAIKNLTINSLEAEKLITIPYPTSEVVVDGKKESIVSAIAFHHGRFIMSLRKKALHEPNVTYIEGTASKLIEENGAIVGVRYKSKGEDDLKEIYAPLTFAIDGLFSKFRKELNPEPPQTSSYFTGFLMTDFPEHTKNSIEYILTKPHPIVVYQISSRCTRFLVDIRGALPKNVKEYLDETIYPQLPDYIKDHYKDAIANAKIRSMPNSSMPANPIEKPGFALLGDAYNIRHPITGGGMSVCLNDVLLWRELLQSVPDLSDYESLTKSKQSFHLQRKLKHSLVINVMADSLYELFAATNEHLITVKLAMLDYFEMGGECRMGPIGLVAGTKPSPFTLLRHFLCIAAIAAYRGFRQDPVWAIHRKIYRTGKVLTASFRMLLALLWVEIKTGF